MVLHAMKNGADGKYSNRVITRSSMETAIAYTHFCNSFKQVLTKQPPQPSTSANPDTVVSYLNLVSNSFVV